MTRGWDRFLVHTRVGGSRKVRRLTPAERWALVAGAWALAAESPRRGFLLIAEGVPVTVEDVAEHAGVTRKVAAGALDKARALGLITVAGDGTEQVHDWDDWQVAPPREDLTAARRQALHRDPELREMLRERDGDRCRYCDVEVNWLDRRSPVGGTYDHIDPFGDNSAENLVVCCRGCNSKKGQRTPVDAAMELLPVSVRVLALRSGTELEPLKEVEEEGKGI